MNSLLPPNATPFELALESTTARISSVPVLVGDLWNPQTCPVAVLPWLAWALSVDYWDRDWPEQVKRDVIANSIEIHRHKGTPWAVEQSLILSGLPSASVEEWFEYSGVPGHFRIRVDNDNRLLSESDLAKLARSVESAKRSSAWLDGVRIATQLSSDITHAAVTSISNKLTIGLFVAEADFDDTTLYAVAVSRLSSRLTIASGD